jgi:nucleotide-binding universal stress UspA family protein
MLGRMHAPGGPVVLGYDGSAAARQAITEAAELLGSRPMLVVTVWEAGLAYAMPLTPADGMTMTPMVQPGVAREVDREVHGQAERLSRDGAELARSLGVDAQPLAVPDEGNVPVTILRVARERRAAAIVVGSRGLTGLRARLEGSTSKGLLNQADCPILVVHEPDEDHH